MPKFNQDVYLPMVPAARVTDLTPTSAVYHGNGQQTFEVTCGITVVSQSGGFLRLLLRAPITYRRV